MRITPLVSSLLLCAGILTGTTAAIAAQNFRELDRPLPMPAFQLPGLDGRGGSDADLRNKVTIIRFWASW